MKSVFNNDSLIGSPWQNMKQLCLHLSWRCLTNVLAIASQVNTFFMDNLDLQTCRKLALCLINEFNISSIGDLFTHSASSFSKSLNTPLGNILNELPSRCLLRFKEKFKHISRENWGGEEKGLLMARNLC